MTQPHTRTFPPNPPGDDGARHPTQVTVAFEPAAPSGGSGERFRVVPVGSAGTSGERDVVEQLRKRLRFIATVAALGEGIANVGIRLALSGGEVLTSIGEWQFRHQFFALSVAVALVELWAIVHLSRLRNATLRHLRIMEVIVFAPVALDFAFSDVQWGPLKRASFPTLWDCMANEGALPTVALIVGYGVLIPNTWWRCAAAVGIFAACAYVGAAIGFIQFPQPAGLVAAYFAQRTVWMGIAGGIVIYGAYRIEILRDQAERGRELGQYRLGRPLGAGGMGEVFRAEHRLLRRPCAIKLIRPDRARDPSALARFEREVQATAALAHPHIVRIHDYGRADDGTFYCVMEYLPGATLDDLVKRHGPLPPDRAVFLLRQLCSALAEAHAAGLTHRDVKPGNVIVRNAGRQADFATLLDFGLVLDRGTGDEKLTADGAVAGTPSFMSPEQAAGDPVDHRADVYAVGAVGYFLLSGRAPFAAGSAMRTIAAVLTEAPKSLDGAPPELAAVIMRCLAKAPGERFASADELDAALAGCVGDGWSHERAADWWAGHTPREPRPGPETVSFAAPGDSPGPTGTFTPQSGRPRGS